MKASRIADGRYLVCDNPYELIDRISLTPYARDELADACASPPGHDSLCAVERARRHDDGSGERLI